MDTHTCPATGCLHELPWHLLFCGTHWSQVPRYLRLRVLREWHGGTPTLAYSAARQEAIDAVNGTAGAPLGTPDPSVHAL